MHTWHIEYEDVVGALRALRVSIAKGPTLLHCEHGADRTGLITALYRIVYQGWDKPAAIDEMLNGDFGFHDVWINIPFYIWATDVAQLRHDLAAADR
jgi:protein tyrosine/serine phosphatase